MSAQLAVIIPHYDDLARLARCLEALLPEGVPAGVEIVVVDNGSPGDVGGVVAQHLGVRLVQETARGAAPARNRGVAATTAPRLAFLDADCVPKPGWLGVALGLGPFEIVGGAVSVFDETPAPRSGPEAFETVFAFDQARYIAEDGFTVTANMLTTREIFADVGGFRSEVSEDRDWCERARAMGYALRYHPELTVAHPTRADWPAIRRKWLRLTRETYGLRREQGPLRWALRAIAVLGSPARDLPRIWLSPRLDNRAERVRASVTLIALRSLRAWWMLRQAVGLPPR